MESANSNEWFYKEFGAGKHGKRNESGKLQLEFKGRVVEVEYDEERSAYIYKIYLDKLLEHRWVSDEEWSEIELERQKHKNESHN